MKDLKEKLMIKESRTSPDNIKNYGRTWISEWGSDFCGNVLTYFIEGVKEGMKKYPNKDLKFQKRCMDCIDKLLEENNEKIY